MPSLNEIVASLYGALRLARFDARGIECFNTSLAGFWRSFFAAVIVAPLYAISLLMPVDGVAVPSTPAYALLNALAYGVSWLAYPVAVELVSRELGCRGRFLAYITAYNWSAVIQHSLMALIVILTGVGLLPLPVGQFLWLLATVYLLIYVWFVARTALAIKPLAACALVALDILLSFAITTAVSAVEATMTAAPTVQ